MKSQAGPEVNPPGQNEVDWLKQEVLCLRSTLATAQRRRKRAGKGDHDGEREREQPSDVPLFVELSGAAGESSQLGLPPSADMEWYDDHPERRLPIPQQPLPPSPEVLRELELWGEGTEIGDEVCKECEVPWPPHPGSREENEDLSSAPTGEGQTRNEGKDAGGSDEDRQSQ